MPAFTPGPWTASYNGVCWQINATEDAVATTQFCYAKDAEANVALIAASPTMYEALEAQEAAVNEHSKCECRTHPEDFLCAMCMTCVDRHLKASVLRSRALREASHKVD